jgi:hypothetical protein
MILKRRQGRNDGITTLNWGKEVLSYEYEGTPASAVLGARATTLLRYRSISGCSNEEIKEKQ